MARVLINVQDDLKDEWVKASHEEYCSLSEWIRRACADRLDQPSLSRIAEHPLSDRQIKDAAEGAMLLAQKTAKVSKPVKAKGIPLESTELPVGDINAGTAPVSTPTATPLSEGERKIAATKRPVDPRQEMAEAATAPAANTEPRLTPQQSSLQAALHEQQPAKQFKPDFKPEAKPKKPRR